MYFNLLFFFFFNDTATTEIYTLSLHDALPIYANPSFRIVAGVVDLCLAGGLQRSSGPDALGERRIAPCGQDRKSTRLNSSHANISYAVFCLKKKNKLGFYYFRPRVSIDSLFVP